MKTLWIVSGALFAVACGGSNNDAKIPTAEDRLNQQIAMAEAQQGDQNEQLSRYEESETTAEEESKFDEAAAQHELKRASLNAVDCPNTFEKAQLAGYAPGKATVSLIFENNGGVKDVTVTAPYAGTPVGDCIVRAMGTVHIEQFKGAEMPMNYDIELGEAKPVDAKTTPAKKK